jgi:hypothetical protein
MTRNHSKYFGQKCNSLSKNRHSFAMGKVNLVIFMRNYNVPSFWLNTSSQDLQITQSLYCATTHAKQGFVGEVMVQRRANIGPGEQLTVGKLPTNPNTLILIDPNDLSSFVAVNFLISYIHKSSFSGKWK